MCTKTDCVYHNMYHNRLGVSQEVPQHTVYHNVDQDRLGVSQGVPKQTVCITRCIKTD